MPGLLDVMTPRNCPRGHGGMEQLPGAFALQGVTPMPGPPGAQRLFVPDGQLVPLRVWHCATCNLLETELYV